MSGSCVASVTPVSASVATAVSLFFLKRPSGVAPVSHEASSVKAATRHAVIGDEASLTPLR